MFAVGARVRQKLPAPIEGEIGKEPGDRRLQEGSDEIEYHVNYTGPDGEAHSRWFAESELEGVEA